MKKALIILDIQEDFLGNTLDYIAPLCQRYLNDFGDRYEAVVLTQWVYEELRGVDTLLLSHPSAYVVRKSGYSGLTNEVRDLFHERSISEVHIAGVDSEGAVMATMFALVDAGYHVKVLERLCSSYHGRNWESMMIVRHCIGEENVSKDGGGQVYF